MADVEAAHFILGFTAITNALLPILLYETIFSGGASLRAYSLFKIVWQIFWVSSLSLWVLPAALFPLTFDTSRWIDHLFVLLVDKLLVCLPFTLHFGQSVAFLLTAMVHNPSPKEPSWVVWTSALLYLSFAGTTSIL